VQVDRYFGVRGTKMYVSADAASMYLVMYFWNSAGSHTCSLDGIMGVIALSGIWGNEEGADIAACREKVVARRRKALVRTISFGWRARLGGLPPYRGICIDVSKAERRK
jgi:hypothetical protein